MATKPTTRKTSTRKTTTTKPATTRTATTKPSKPTLTRMPMPKGQKPRWRKKYKGEIYYFRGSEAEAILQWERKKLELAWIPTV